MWRKDLWSLLLQNDLNRYNNTVESCYLELGNLEFRVISNWKSIPLKLTKHLYQFAILNSVISN